MIGHMSNHLKSKNIKHAIVQFKPGEVGHMAIAYAVNEPSKSNPDKLEENWYILDMARVVAMVLTQIPNPDKEAFDELWALENQTVIKGARDAAKIPLIAYSEWRHGFQNAPIVYAVDPDSVGSLRPDTWAPYNALSLGDYLVKNSPEFAKKYLILDAAGESGEARWRDSKGNPVPKSRRWLREINEPGPTFLRTFRMEATIGGQRTSVPGVTIPYNNELYYEQQARIKKLRSRQISRLTNLAGLSKLSSDT